ncbi:MFS transporter [Neolewinella persica]|uniref:MFS transporter n=1 Tax=Neolewinella persica TaxID=70998 RepID=UPI00036827EE|nr:MFS transporter [Neolewinella persica]
MSTTTTKTFADVPANRDRLFFASCMALVVTSMTFAIRAATLKDYTSDFGLSDAENGQVASMVFYGFPVAMLIGGFLYNQLGPKLLLLVAFVCHLIGLTLWFTSSGYWGLMGSTFLVGFANGSVEAACNPLVADMYPDKKTQMLNRFHVWFPGGLVIGSLIAYFFGGSLGWEMLVAVALVPTLIYGALIFGQTFPKTQNIVGDMGENIKGVLTPLFIIMALIMTVTATTEFGAGQWVDRILGSSGAHPMILLGLTYGVMALGRFFAGPIVHRFNAVGVLLLSAILSVIGLYILGNFTGGMVYIGAIVFGLGICYFWPTMLGFTAENIPKSGALGLALIGGAGMLGAGIWQPFIGGWIDNYRGEALRENPELVEQVSNYYQENPDELATIENLPEEGNDRTLSLYTAYTGTRTGLMEDLAGEDPNSAEAMAIKQELEPANEVELAAGQGTLSRLLLFPAVLIAVFAGLYFFMKNRTPAEEAVLNTDAMSTPGSAM